MPYQISFISLGCAKNLVNCEQMMALCRDAGHTVREAVPGSDVCVVNTCGFIDSAKEEAIDTILSVAKYKETGEVKKILVTGCLPQRYQREVMEEVGLKVKNIRYYKSQPWSFTDTLLFGFYCDLDGSGQVKLDTDELAVAEWFERKDVPGVDGDVSLTQEMMCRFRDGLNI